MAALFEKSMEELRESFVRARYAEGVSSGSLGAEERLDRERTATVPNRWFWRQVGELHELRRKAPTIFGMSDGEIAGFLERFCDAGTTTPPVNFLTEWGSERGLPYLPLVQHLTDVRIYWTANYGPIIVCGSASNVAIFSIERNYATLKPGIVYRDEYVIDALVTTWQLGGPKADTAREFLCDVCTQVFADIRQHAENDFDHAVAVSADGKRIVCADFVVVVEPRLPTSRGWWYPGKTFRENKLLLTPDRNRVIESAFLYALQLVKTISAGSFLSGLGPLLHSLDVTRDKSKVFVTLRAYCPDPLPDGGTLLKS